MNYLEMLHHHRVIDSDLKYAFEDNMRKLFTLFTPAQIALCFVSEVQSPTYEHFVEFQRRLAENTNDVLATQIYSSGTTNGVPVITACFSMGLIQNLVLGLPAEILDKDIKDERLVSIFKGKIRVSLDLLEYLTEREVRVVEKNFKTDTERLEARYATIKTIQEQIDDKPAK